MTLQFSDEDGDDTVRALLQNYLHTAAVVREGDVQLNMMMIIDMNEGLLY